MRKVLNLTAILGMFFLAASCGDSAKDKEQGQEDANAAANELFDEANNAAAEPEAEAPKDTTGEAATKPATPVETEGEAAPAGEEVK
ncbi:MAG: hypothetical protein HYZ16_08805 [Bacteroidetes bacterium]|jgi:hypothetical protein|nr:hypothetical protein [Bacteroidota bacterium]